MATLNRKWERTEPCVVPLFHRFIKLDSIPPTVRVDVWSERKLLM